jgi:serine/threonine-protein kinase
VAVETTGALLAGRYRVLRPLGSGGMATVFLCEDEKLGRRVAVKRLHPYGAAEDVAIRFEREAKLGASLNHPNVVSVFDTVREDEGALIVMEYVDGETLAEALRRGPLEPSRAGAVVLEVAAALDYAHSHGVLHRDVKPGNVLLREDGVVKLADLGIATAEFHTRITSSDVVLGTASYMAPEQLDGGDAGPRTDVYALAAVAFEALSGRKARPAANPLEIAHQIATGPPPDLLAAWPEAPAGAAVVLSRGMARRPEDRPWSSGELAADLARALRERSARPARVLPSRVAVERPSAALPRLEVRSPIRGGARRRAPRWAPGAALAAVLVATIAVVAFGGGDSVDSGDRASGPRGERAQADGRERPDSATREPATAREDGVDAPAAAPGQPEAESGGADGAALNAEGYRLMQQGDYAAAIPVLQRAVEAFPEGTTDINYAYALYNLGRSLRLAGRPEEAIPILEQRLQIPNQTGTVRSELEAARRDAGQAGDSGNGSEGKAKGKNKDKGGRE